MDIGSWMYQELSVGFYKQDYLEGVEGFISFILSNPKNISECQITCSCAKCKNKKFHHKYLNYDITSI